MANESENSCGKPPVPAAVAAVAGAAPRRSCRARRLNTRFVNDEVDEGYRQLVARIAAPDSHSILQSPQLAFHHLSPAPPLQPTASFSTPPSSKTSVVAVTATATNAASSTVAHAKKGVVSSVTSVRKPSVVKQMRRNSQESVNSEKDGLTGKRLHQESVNCEESDKSFTIKKTTKLIGNSVRKIKASVPSFKSQKSKKHQPASPVSDSEDDIPLANLLSRGSTAASEWSSDDELPLTELAARNKQVESGSYNCDLPSNYCIKTIHNPDLSSTPISIVCIEDPDEVDQLETPKVKKVKRKSFPKMFNTAKKTKLDLTSATSNEKNKSKDGLITDHFVEQSQVKRKTSPLLKDGVVKKESKESKNNTKNKVKLPLKPSQGKLLKILNLKVVPTSLPELPKDNPLIKLIENRNAESSCSEINHQRTTIKFAVFSPKIPSKSTELDKEVPICDEAKNSAITSTECAKDGLTQTLSEKPIPDSTSVAAFVTNNFDTQKGTGIKGASGTSNTGEVGTLIPKQEANHSSVSGQPNASHVNYNALSSILKSESPPCLDGLIKVEMTSGKSMTKNETTTTNLSASTKIKKSKIFTSEMISKGSNFSKSILCGTASPVIETTTCLKANASRSQFEQSPATLLVAKTELHSEWSQASQVSSPLTAHTVYGSLSSELTVPAPKEKECQQNQPFKWNTINTDELKSSNSSTKATPNKIQNDNLPDEAKIKCKRRSESSPCGGSSGKKLKQETNDESPKVNKSNATNAPNTALHQGFADQSQLKSEKVAINYPRTNKDDPALTKAAARQSCENAVFHTPKQLKADPYEQKPDLAIIRDTREQWETDDKSKALVLPLPPRNEEYKEKMSMAKKEATNKVKIAKKVPIESNNSISPNKNSNSSVNKSSNQDSLTRNVSSKGIKGVSPPSASVDTKVDIKPALLITKIIDGIETEVKPYVKRREQPSSPKVNDSITNRESKSMTASNKSCEPSAYQKIDHVNKSKSTNPIVKSEPLDTSPEVISPSSSRRREPDTVQAIEDKASTKQKEKSKEKKDRENKIRSNIEKEKNKTTKGKFEKECSGMECKTKDSLGKGITKQEKVTETKESSDQNPQTDVNKTIIKEHKTKGNGDRFQKRDESAKIHTGKGGHTKGTTEKGDKTKKTTDQDHKAKVNAEKDVKVKESIEKEKTKESREKEEKIKGSLETMNKDKEKSKGRIENEIKGKEKSILRKESRVKEAKSSKGTINSEDKIKGKGDKEHSVKDNQLNEEKSKSGIKKETKELTSEGPRRESRDKSPSGHRSSSSSKEHRSKSSHHRRSSSSDHKVKDDRNSAKRRDSSLSSKYSKRVCDTGDTKQLKKGESSSPTLVDDHKDLNAIFVNVSNTLMDSDEVVPASVNNSEQHIELNQNFNKQKSVTLSLPNTITTEPGYIKPPLLQESVTKAAYVEETPDKNTVPVVKKEIHMDVIDQKPISSVTELLNMCRANIPPESALRLPSSVQSSAVLACNSLLDLEPQTVNSVGLFVVSAEEASKRASSNLLHLLDGKPIAARDELVSHTAQKSSILDSGAPEDEKVTHHLDKYTDTCAVLLERMEFDDGESSKFSIQRHGTDCSVEIGNCMPSSTKTEDVLVNNTSVDGSASPASNSSSPSPLLTKREPSPAPPETVEEREQRETLEAERKIRNKAIVEMRMKTFEHLTENLYLTDRKKSKQSKEVRRMVCDCTLTKEELSRGEKGCGDDCLNRLLMIECGWRCPIGDACLNRRFQLCKYGPVEVFNAEEKGCGVKAIQEIPPGTFILEYVGEVFDQREFRRRRKEYGKDGTAHFYFMALRADQFIDATKKGNISRFVNHSCDPNAETQKWTVNGELRIGFFSTKTISEGEEINFDYRMERYGREPQKCYCGTAVCRGWLGEPPDELTKEEKEEERRRNALTAISDKPVDKRTKEDKKQQFDDELQDDLSELRRVGLRNRQYTLMLSRVMVRAESEHTRSQLLVLLQAAHANTPCLRLFMDYHGLSLLWSWMADLGIDLEHAPLKLEILKTLDILPISNRTQVADSRVLEVVEKWSKQTTPPPSTSFPIDTKRTAASATTDTNKKSSDGSEDSDDVTVDESSQDSVDAPTSGTTKLPSSDDSSSDSNSSKRCSILPQKSLVDVEAMPLKPQLLAQKEDLLRKAQTEMVELALKLVTRWQVLKEEFRIPRKQRVQLMKEHEREVEAGYRRYLDTERGRREVMDSRYNTRRDSYYDSWRNKMVPDHDKDGRRWQVNDTAISINDAEFAGLSKEERREKFAQKVAIEDEQRRVQEGMWNVHVERCARSGLDPYQTPIIDPSGQYYWDASNSTWVPLTPQTAYAAGVMDPATAQQHAAAMTALAGGDPSLCYPSDMEPETAINPHCIPTVNGEVLQPVVVTINLPPHWHIARDQHNRVYFYHSRSRQTQWDIPTLDTKTTLQYETDSESDSESSSSSDSEEEFSSDEGDANDDEVAMASAGGEANNEEPESLEGKIIRRQRGRKRHSEALVQQRVISPIRELDREQARKERREAKERARHEARRERLQYQEQLLSKELGVADEDDSDADQETIIDEPKMLYPPRDKFKVKSKERAATAIADTSDKARKIKDLFRSRMATFIVSVLNPYRRVDCKQGRINTTEDFKYLARKLTHFVMVKELKQLPSIEGLDCSDSVKHKTKDFVRKYMAKYGSSFKRDPNDTKEY